MGYGEGGGLEGGGKLVCAVCGGGGHAFAVAGGYGGFDVRKDRVPTDLGLQSGKRWRRSLIRGSGSAMGEPGVQKGDRHWRAR